MLFNIDSAWLDLQTYTHALYIKKRLLPRSNWTYYPAVSINVSVLNGIKLMQQEINLRTFASHTLLPCTGKLEKEDLVVLISFYEIKRGNTRYFYDVIAPSKSSDDPAETLFFIHDFKNYCSNPGIFPSAISSRITNNSRKRIKIIQQNIQLIKKYISAHPDKRRGRHID